MTIGSFLKKWMKRLLIAAFVLFTLGVLLVVFENWRAKRDWHAYKAEWEAKGERFDRAAFLPPDVPDDQNIAATPLLAPLLHWEPEPLDPLSHLGKPPLPEAITDGVVKVCDWLRLVGVGGGFMESRLSKLQLGAPLAGGVDTNMMKRYGLAPTPAPSEPPVTQETKQKGAKPVGASQAMPSTEEIEAVLANPERSVAANVLAVFDRFSAQMNELATAAKRPCLVLSDPGQYDPVPKLLTGFGVLKPVVQAFRVRALARLAEHESAGAVADVKTILRLNQAMRSEPLLITGLVRVAFLSIALQPVWEGLARHAWDDAQLRELEQMLSQVNFVSESAEMLRAERAYSLRVLDLMLRSPGELGQSQSEVLQLGIPSGRGLLHRLLPAVIYRNELAIARMYQEDLLARLDTDRQVVDVVGLWAADTDPAIRTLKKQALLRPYSAMADAMLPAVASSTEKFTLIHAYVVLARVACALERHRLADGDYPADLQALVPDYLPALPADPAGGGVLFYRRLSANNFLLYSGGPNARDDGGKIVRRDNPNHGADPRNEKSDWVWTYPSGE